MRIILQPDHDGELPDGEIVYEDVAECIIIGTRITSPISIQHFSHTYAPKDDPSVVYAHLERMRRVLEG